MNLLQTPETLCCLAMYLEHPSCKHNTKGPVLHQVCSWLEDAVESAAEDAAHVLEHSVCHPAYWTAVRVWWCLNDAPPPPRQIGLPAALKSALYPPVQPAKKAWSNTGWSEGLGWQTHFTQLTMFRRSPSEIETNRNLPPHEQEIKLKTVMHCCFTWWSLCLPIPDRLLSNQ